MRLLTKAGFGFLLLLLSIAAAPNAKADPIVIKTGGFELHNLGNNGTGLADLDTLIGAASSNSTDSNGLGSFIAETNPLTFITGFTGNGSGGSYSFSFSQELTINGQTQILNLLEDILGPSPSLLANTHNVSTPTRIDAWSISDLTADFQ